MAMMKKWLRGIAYTALATLIVAAVISGVLVFLAIGAVIGTVILLGSIIWFVAYLIKEAWEYRATP